MGTVIMIWLLQWGVVIFVALAHANIQGFVGRLRAAILQPAVWMLAGGCVAFTYASGRAFADGDYVGAILGGISLLAELTFLAGTILTALFRRFAGPDTTFGSARFATIGHAMQHGLLGTDGIRLGYFRHPGNTRPDQPQPLQYTGQRHLLTVAPTRAGKGVSAIIPNLLTYGGSAIVIDPKGENARITYDRRAKIGRAFALDPWGISGKPAARFNPMSMLTPDSPTLIEDATLLSEAIVVAETQGNGKHFSERAANATRTIMMHQAVDPAEECTLGRLRTILTMTPKEFAKIGSAMARSPHPVVRAGAAELIGMSDTERSGVISTAQRNTQFLDSPALRKSLSGSDFRFADLKSSKPTTVYLILPVDRLSSHNRWLRLLIAQAIAELARTPMQAPRPVLFLLDEFAQLGHMPLIEDAYGLMAGMGLIMWAIVQDFGQLRRLYGEGWQTFLGNAGMIQCFGTRDLFTAQYVSDLIGKTTTIVRSTSTSSGTSSSSSSGPNGSHSTGTNSGTSISHAPTQRPLLFPDELMRMDRGAQVMFIENADPVLASKIVWHDDPAYRHLGRLDPGAPVLDREPVIPPLAGPPQSLAAPSASPAALPA